MPLYEYEHVGEKGIRCSEVFDFVHPVSERLDTCPSCGRPVRKRVVPFGVIGDVLAPSNLKDKGFHKWVRRDKGVYEKE